MEVWLYYTVYFGFLDICEPNNSNLHEYAFVSSYTCMRTAVSRSNLRASANEMGCRDTNGSAWQLSSSTTVALTELRSVFSFPMWSLNLRSSPWPHSLQQSLDELVLKHLILLLQVSLFKYTECLKLMYTLFKLLFLSNEMRQKYNFCWVWSRGHWKASNAFNVLHVFK